MNSITNEFKSMVYDIRDFFYGVWDSVHSFLANIFGESTANLFLIAIGAFLIIFLMMKFINRD